jgi:hypothetical protein
VAGHRHLRRDGARVRAGGERAAGLTGVLTALAVVLLADGYATMRRVTV